MNVQIGKDANRAIRKGRVRRPDDVRVRPEGTLHNSILSHRARSDESNRCVILITVEIGLLQGRAAGKLRFFQSSGVIVAAERKPPDFVDIRTSTRLQEIAPRDLS